MKTLKVLPFEGMKALHPILKDGNVYIAAKCPLLLVATFVDSNNRIVTVNSDKGVDHLFCTLAARVELNIPLLHEVSADHVYTLSAIDVDETVRILEKSYTKFSFDNEKGYRVSIKQILVPALDSIPGVYMRRAYGSSLAEAFALAIEADPILYK